MCEILAYLLVIQKFHEGFIFMKLRICVTNMSFNAIRENISLKTFLIYSNICYSSSKYECQGAVF